MLADPVLQKYTARPAVWDDIPAIVDVCNALVIAQWGFPDWTVEDAETDFAQPDYDMSDYIRLWHDDSDRLVGVCMVFALSEPPVRPRANPYILPDLPDFHELGLEMLAWGEELTRRVAVPRCPADAKVQMISWTFATHEPTIALYKAFGMEKVRQFWTMEIALHDALPAPVLPQGMTIRTLRYPDEGRAAYRLTDEAFSDHYGHVDDPEMKNYDGWAHYKFNSSSFDPALWFIAEVDGEPAGFSWCHLGMPEDPKLGWVATLGVLPAFRRRGIANLLLQHSFREFYVRGMHKAGLGVDATNITGATRVYERAGMHCIAKWDTYAKLLRDGVELVRE